MSDFGGGRRATPEESVIAILDDFVKPRFLGRNQRYKLIVTEKQLVFLRINKRWFFRRKSGVSDEAIREVSPLEIKRLSLGSYIFQIRNISSITVRESIPFVLLLDPKDAVNFNLVGAEDDIVHEVPMVLKRDKVKGVDVVERQWEITFENPRAFTSFILPYDPRLKLPRNLLEKIR